MDRLGQAMVAVVPVPGIFFEVEVEGVVVIVRVLDGNCACPRSALGRLHNLDHHPSFHQGQSQLPWPSTG